MKGRVIAWVVVLGLGYGGVVLARRLENPWKAAAAVSPITAVMPPMPECSEKCK